MTVPTPPSGPGVPEFTKPEGLILVKGSNDSAVYGIWPSGFNRQITYTEFVLWGAPALDRVIPADDPDAAAQLAQLAAYDRALRA